MSAFRKIVAAEVPEPPGASWSNCLLIGREVVFSGVTARTADGNAAGGDSMAAQTAAIFAKIKAQLAAAGGRDGNIYRLVIYVTDIARKDEVNAARKAAFRDVYPCSTLVEVSGFVFPDLLVEVDAFANLDVDLQAEGADR
ncbi:RidA family protein [Oceanibacterium hippocampi]|uniref:Putative aminoacrylate peracid reductase RutC n=1 Tax=Oceanibacterium hippocampi TaxID=745714 RepID=A0A1Y5TGC4_9PROT|nr:RidA family protein [Oceanibacterium hippocampi]SLN63595.1 Putative aminoacrylate peracid reductase RutC [Oceanibacterium hippocampi]